MKVQKTFNIDGKPRTAKQIIAAKQDWTVDGMSYSTFGESEVFWQYRTNYNTAGVYDGSCRVCKAEDAEDISIEFADGVGLLLVI